MPKIKNMGAGTARFKEGMYISGSAHQSDGTDSDFSLVVSGSIKVESGAGSQPGITFQKGEDDIHFIRFAAADDGTSSNATLTYQQAEHIFIQPGRGGDFYIQARTTESSDPFTFPFSVMDNGTARFEKGLSDSNFRNTNLTDDVTFFVSGSDDYQNTAVFGGNVVVSGSLSMTGSTGLTSLNVYGNTAGAYVATIDNDENTNGHVLKLSTDGNGSGTRILEMEDGDGDIVFRARADGRFGFGPDGVSSMGAGTFVVGIDNSSHTTDIAISQRLQHLGDSNTYLDFPAPDTFNLVAGGNSFLKYDNNGSILINNANANVDTKIMADDGNVVLHVDAGTNKVGIGTTSPAEVLTLNATESTILFEEGGTDKATIGINNSDNIVIENKTVNKHIVFKVNDQAVVREGLRINGAVPEVVVNESSESLINFRVESDNNTHMLFVTGSDKVGIGTSSPISELDVSGSIAITKAISTPAQPAVDQGYLYTKVDGKLYWRSYTLSETDLTAAGGGGTKHFAYGHCDLETNNKPVNWINAASVSSSAAEKTWFIVPFAATLDKIIVTVKANNFSTANDGNITLNVYKNQPNFDATIISQTVGADDFTEKVSNMNGNSDCNQKIFSGLNASLAEGDLLQMKVGKSAGSDHEALVTMIFVG